MSRIGMALLVTIAAVLTGPAFAQPRPGGRPGGSGLPKVGTTLPEVAVFDEQGREFSTRALRGHYSVLVFGCLT